MRIRSVAVAVSMMLGLALMATSVVASTLATQETPDEATEVPVDLSEWSIDARHLVVKANQPIRLVLKNSGQLPHALSVSVQGEEWTSERAAAGASVVWEVSFSAPGVYQMWCPVGNGRHKDQGMVGTITVVPQEEDTVMNTTVQLGDFSIQPISPVLIAGQPTRLWLQNVGVRPHALVIVGRGQQMESARLMPGEATVWDVVLQEAGTYEIFCPVGAHKQLGMLGTLEVLRSAS